jgi:5-oxopent-3-ene-1,2,5-tricarboxylate decarboxylase/2-hydroxyhepta-2,4-diene-1,7-dioate isomerase
MALLSGSRRELRHVVYGGSATWAEMRDGELRLADGRVVAEAEVQHLPPCSPTKIICPHVSYRSRWREFGREGDPQNPSYFHKPVSSLNSHNGALLKPKGHYYLNYEGELGVVIGRVTRNVLPEEVWDNIAGFTVANDAGLQDMRDTDNKAMVRVKGADSLCPIGPGLVTGVDPRQQTLRTYRNGKLVQEAVIAEDLVFGIDTMIADLARHITFVPGDLVLTGTPCNSRSLDAGDVIEVEVSGIGRLRNVVVEVPAPRADIGHQPQDSQEARRIAFGNDDLVPEHLR